MNEPEWVAYDVLLAIHEAQLAEHGGSPGIRDQGLINSALSRPQNLYAYSEHATLPQLAAVYAFGIVKNHGFIDGNKQTAWVVCAVFLELNGFPVKADQVTVVAMMLGIASGEITEEKFARWLQTQASS